MCLLKFLCCYYFRRYLLHVCKGWHDPHLPWQIEKRVSLSFFAIFTLVFIVL